MSKKLFAAFAMLLGFNAAAAAQTCSPPTVADSVALNPVSGSNLMTVPVAINGTPRLFLLQVGRTPDQVSEATMAELHLPQTTQTTGSSGLADMNTGFQFHAAMYDVRSGVTATDFQSRVRIADFTIGRATVHDVVFMVANDRDLGKSKPYDGLLTTGLFSQYDVDLDFGGAKFSFVTATSCADPNQVAYWPHAVVAVIPMTMTNGKISVPVMIDGHSIDAVIDTGSDHTVMRRGTAERTFGLKADTAQMTPAGDLRDGTGERIYQHTFSQIAFGGVIANNVPAFVQTNSMVHKINREPTLGSRAHFDTSLGEQVPELALGMDVLHQLHIYAAFGESKLYVTPAAAN
jgi:predicted aspartyl protease